MPIDCKREQSRWLSHHAYVDCHECALQKKTPGKGNRNPRPNPEPHEKTQNLNVRFRGLRQRSPVVFLIRHGRCPI
jgi:hypothetical protein